MGVYRQHSPHHQTRAVNIVDKIGVGFIADNVAERPNADPQII
jgi:hypothetical protein